jgi:hypothetical protein
LFPPGFLDQKSTASHTRAGNERRLFPPEQSSKTSTFLNEVSVNSNKFSSAWSGVIATRSQNLRSLIDDRLIARVFFSKERSRVKDGVAAESICLHSLVVCIARLSRCFTNWQACRATSQLRDVPSRQRFGEPETLLCGSVCVMEFIRMRFRISRS